MKPGRTGIQRIIFATGYSLKGLQAAWINEAAFRQELVASALLTMSLFFSLSLIWNASLWWVL